MTRRHHAVLIIPIAIMLCSACAREEATIYGAWRFDAEESTDIVAWRDRELRLEIRDLGDAVTIVHDWQHRSHGSWTDSLTIFPGREPVTAIVESPVWPGNWYMGVLSRVGSEKTTKATWLEKDRHLVTEIEQVVEVSQGEATVSSTIEYAVDRNGDKLMLTERRSTRPTPVELVFDRATGGAGE